MHTRILRDFFLGKASAADLASDLVGARVPKGNRTTEHLMDDDLDENFPISIEHLVSLCDAVIDNQLKSCDLKVISFSMIASDNFDWDADSDFGGRIADTVYDWSAPEINYVLRTDTVKKFRHRLITGEDTFTSDDFSHQEGDPSRVVWRNPSKN